MSLAATVPPCIPFDGTPTASRPLQISHARSEQKLALVIPTLREAGNICPLLRRVRQALDSVTLDYEVLVVDDDSRDGTAEIVTSITREDSRVRLLVREGQTGLSGALLHGWQHSNAAILGAMDADLQHPPELLPNLVSAILSGWDLAIGSRYAAGAGWAVGIPRGSCYQLQRCG